MIFTLLTCSLCVVCSCGINIEVSLMTERLRGVRESSEDVFLDVDKERNFWSNWLAELNGDFLGNIKKSLSDPEWWSFWVQLSEETREEAISRFLPMLSKRKKWNLHCSDAFQLCLADRSCRWRFWNYLSSCSTQRISLRDWVSNLDKRSDFSSYRIRRNVRDAQKRPKTHRKGRRKRRKRKNKNLLPPYLKRVFRTKSSRTTWFKTTVKLHYWMGRYWSNIFDSGFSKRECSSKCLNALLMLNQTIYSTLLATCNCSRKAPDLDDVLNEKHSSWNEAKCKTLKAKAFTCRPRLFKQRKAVLGCTESRLRCQNNPKCKSAQKNFLLKCSRVISGVACSRECREAIKKLSMTSQHFNTCVCDGTEKHFCSVIRENIRNLCPKKNCFANSGATQDGRSVTRHNAKCEINKPSRRTKKSISHRLRVFNGVQGTVTFSLHSILLANILVLLISIC